MKRIFALLATLILYACSNKPKQPAPSPGVLQNTQETITSDSTMQITDSVVIKDTTTADVESMKKIN